MATSDKILVAVDLTDDSPHIIGEGLRTARAHGAEIVLVHSVHQLDALYGIYLGGGSVTSLQHDVESTAREKLHELFEAHLKDSGVPCRETLLRGVPWSEIVGCAMHYSVLQIVMGAHMKDKPSHQMLGSTVQRVLRHAACPVLVVPPEWPD